MALFVSYLPVLKPLALCLSAGLMLNWTRHYPSLSNTHKHTPSLLSSSTHSSLVLSPRVSFSSSFWQIFSPRWGEKGESERVRSRHSKLCMLRQAGQYSPSRFLACHSNLLDPLSNRQTSCKHWLLYACVCYSWFISLSSSWLVCKHWTVWVHTRVHPSKKLECSCCQEIVSL